MFRIMGLNLILLASAMSVGPVKLEVESGGEDQFMKYCIGHYFHPV